MADTHGAYNPRVDVFMEISHPEQHMMNMVAKHKKYAASSIGLLQLVSADNSRNIPMLYAVQFCLLQLLKVCCPGCENIKTNREDG